MQSESGSENAESSNTCNLEDGARQPLLSSSLPKCPVCELQFDYVDLTDHIDICLRTYETVPEDNGVNGMTDEDNDVEIDAIDGLETYTWAGQTRVRSTSLIDGGLRGAGFLTITRGDEDQVRRNNTTHLLRLSKIKILLSTYYNLFN